MDWVRNSLLSVVPSMGYFLSGYRTRPYLCQIVMGHFTPRKPQNQACKAARRRSKPLPATRSSRAELA